MFRFFGAFFQEGKGFWGASAQAPTGCYFRALRRSNRAASVSAFGDAPSLPPSGFRPPSGLRGSTHSPRRFTSRGGTPRLASLSPRLCSRAPLHSAARVFRRATAFYRPSFYYGRHKAKKPARDAGEGVCRFRADFSITPRKAQHDRCRQSSGSWFSSRLPWLSFSFFWCVRASVFFGPLVCQRIGFPMVCFWVAVSSRFSTVVMP